MTQIRRYTLTKWLFYTLIFQGLVACHSTTKPNMPLAALPSKVFGTDDAVMMNMQNKFNKKGIRVITIGEDYLISIPSKALFPDGSPQVTWNAYAVLNDVACFLRQFRKIAVSVTGFTGKCVSMKREQALTLARARAVADYLWSQGIDSRFIFTQGMGSDKPIIAGPPGGDRSGNSRIEIIFRDAVA